MDHTPSLENRTDSFTKVLVGGDYFKHPAWLEVISEAVIEGACQENVISQDGAAHSPT